MLKAGIHFRGGQGVVTGPTVQFGKTSLAVGPRPSPRAVPTARPYRGKQASRSELSRTFASTRAARRRWRAVGWAGLR